MAARLQKVEKLVMQDAGDLMTIARAKFGLVDCVPSKLTQFQKHVRYRSVTLMSNLRSVKRRESEVRESSYVKSKYARLACLPSIK